MYILRDYKAPKLSTKVNLNTGLSYIRAEGCRNYVGFQTF